MPDCALWQVRERVTLEKFQQDLLSGDAELKVTFPVLRKFFEERIDIMALTGLPALIHFSSLLIQRFSKRIGLDHARTLTIEKVLELTPDGQQAAWVAAFEHYATAWNAIWPRVTHFECTPLVGLRDLVVSPTTTLDFLLPAPNGNGVCFVALLTLLRTKHNAFVDALGDWYSARNQQVPAPALVPSSRFSASDALAYDEREYERFVVQQCVRYDSQGTLQLDFERAEHFLIDRYLAGKPKMQEVTIWMQYLSSVGVDGAEGAANFRSAALDETLRVPQVTLPLDVLQSILRELSTPPQRRASLQLVEQAIVFLQESAGRFADVGKQGAELRLMEYLERALLMDADHVQAQLGLGRNSLFASHMRLQHLVSLVHALRESLTNNPFAHTAPQYVFK
jgi:hypothetical protein